MITPNSAFLKHKRILMNVWKRYPYLNAPLTAWSSRRACQGSSSTHGETKVNVALDRARDEPSEVEPFESARLSAALFWKGVAELQERTGCVFPTYKYFYITVCRLSPRSEINYSCLFAHSRWTIVSLCSNAGTNCHRKTAERCRRTGCVSPVLLNTE